MRIRFQPTLCFLLLLASPLLRAQQEADSAPFVPRTFEQAEAQLQRAEDMRKEAKQRFTDEEAACYQKILVNDCIDEAKGRYTKTIVEARRLEAPAREFKREFRREEVIAEKDQRAAEQPAREAEQQQRAERYRADEAAKADKREQKIQDKERRAEENRRKLAEQQAQRQLKAEKRAKKQAERIEKTAKKRAKAEKKAADEAARESEEKPKK
jgi:colicin import membrane protein